jgi:cytosine/adenosine deaminase-related metal-dependent hydrolase
MSAITELGGIHNAHLHLDRAGTIKQKYMAGASIQPFENSHISLAKKHSLISILHDGLAYDLQDLSERINYYIDEMVSVGTSRADTAVDVTCDRVKLSALKVICEVKRRRKNEINLHIGAYSPFGFKDSEPERWDLLLEGAEIADFVASLPERDDTNYYPSHIGFHEHCKRMLFLSQQIDKPIHIHVDQRNEPSENGTETIIQLVKENEAQYSRVGEPMVWLVHVISPSTYSEARFKELVKGLVTYNIGVICCPSAAIGMRQLRPLRTPTYNSIARILEMLAAGVHVRLGSDNIADICSPSGTPDLTDEIFILSNAIRFYHIGILAKLASGVRLNSKDRQLIKQHLYNNDLEIDKVLRQL